MKKRIISILLTVAAICFIITIAYCVKEASRASSAANQSESNQTTEACVTTESIINEQSSETQTIEEPVTTENETSVQEETIVIGETTISVQEMIDYYKANRISMEDARAYAVETAPDFISTHLGLTTAGYANLDEKSEFYLGGGYYTYINHGDLFFRNENVCIPVLQNDTVVMVLHIGFDEGEWFCTGSTDLVEILNQNPDTLAIVYYYKDEKYYNSETYLLTTDSLVPKRDTAPEMNYEQMLSHLAEAEDGLDNLNNLLYSTYNESNIPLGYVENPVGRK